MKKVRRSLVTLTSLFIKCFLLKLISSLEAAPVYILFGDFGQMHPVIDLSVYTMVSQTVLSGLRSSAYKVFDHAVLLEQDKFLNIVLHWRDGYIWQKRTGNISWIKYLLKYKPLRLQQSTRSLKFMPATSLLKPFKKSQMHPRLHLMLLLDWINHLHSTHCLRNLHSHLL